MACLILEGFVVKNVALAQQRQLPSNDQTDEGTTQKMSYSELAVRIAAVMAASGFAFFAGFQILLALGAPWGVAAHGGFHEGVLPPRLRIASAASAVMLIVAALLVIGRGGYWGDTLPSGIFHWGTWSLVALITLSAFANFASSSNWERFLWAPVTLLLSFLCLVVLLTRSF